jgi:DNA-binding transcriptional LysR family regulator
MSRFWPVGEAAQSDYETLREAALAGLVVASPAATRFARAGLAGLIVRPVAEPVFVASLSGAPRPPWTPYDDPRTQALAAGYEVVVTWAGHGRARSEQTCSTGPDRT